MAGGGSAGNAASSARFLAGVAFVAVSGYFAFRTFSSPHETTQKNSQGTSQGDPTDDANTDNATQHADPDSNGSLEFEARISKKDLILLVLSKEEEEEEVEGLVKEFCGAVFNIADAPSLPSFSGKTVYLAGDIAKAQSLAMELKVAKRVFIIRELSHGFEGTDSSVVELGRVPINVHSVGVLYPRFFDPCEDYFKRICAEHEFQNLTESTKPGKAYRTGIYLTPVRRVGDDSHFHLLRCSSNLSGPTLNFRATDRHIVDALNQEANALFDNPAPLNHVLAQIYHNTAATGTQKETKAKIKAHADKTKDMPKNGIMAFCTFYDQLDKLKPIPGNGYDFGTGRKGTTSGLTKLQFRLKKPVEERPGCTLTRQFSVSLYPGSVFFMPLSTNRFYTHEIRPSSMEASRLPTRMGYVVRCSETEAVHRDGHTHIKVGNDLVRMGEPTREGMSELRAMYAEENVTDNFVHYNGKFLFSMNEGDYLKPQYDIADEFRCYTLPVDGDIFKELLASVKFEGVLKGRRGAVVVNPDDARGSPIVRMTDHYDKPAQCFKPIHVRLAQQIQGAASLPLSFNNAMIETYTNEYFKMGFHSDQALDLDDRTSIAVFSCYESPEVAVRHPRKLVVQSKESGGGTFEIPMKHNSVVVWSIETNRRFRHKIVLDTGRQPPDNQWLGVTFRTSKTFVRVREDDDGRAYFENGTPLTVAKNEEERGEFYRLRGRENKEINFTYPPLGLTISPQDTMPPERPEAKEHET